jgi:hypothetical protein
MKKVVYLIVTLLIICTVSFADNNTQNRSQYKGTGSNVSQKHPGTHSFHKRKGKDKFSQMIEKSKTHQANNPKTQGARGGSKYASSSGTNRTSKPAYIDAMKKFKIQAANVGKKTNK